MANELFPASSGSDSDSVGSASDQSGAGKSTSEPPATTPKRRWYRLHWESYLLILLVLVPWAIVAVRGVSVSGFVAHEASCMICDHGWPWIYLRRYEINNFGPNPPSVEDHEAVSKHIIEELEQNLSYGEARRLSNDSLNWASSSAGSWESSQRIDLTPLSMLGDWGPESSPGWWSQRSNPEQWKQTATKPVLYKWALFLDLLVAAAIVFSVVGPYEWWRRRRQRWTYSLRSLLIGLTLVAVFLAWGRNLVTDRNRELVHIAKLESMGFEVRYDCEAPLWLIRLVGLDRLSYFYRVSEIDNFDGRLVGDGIDDEVSEYERQLEELLRCLMYEHELVDGLEVDEQDPDLVDVRSEVLRILEETKGRFNEGLDGQVSVIRDLLRRLPDGFGDQEKWRLVKKETSRMVDRFEAKLEAKFNADQFRMLGSIIPQFGSLESLVYRQEYDGSMKQLEGVSGFTELTVYAFEYTDQDLESLATLSQLERLELTSGFGVQPLWTPEGWTHLQALPNLKVLHVREDISDEDLAEIAKISTLETLSVTANISGETVLMLGSLRQLKWLGLTCVLSEDDSSEKQLQEGALKKLRQMRPDVDIETFHTAR